MKATSGQAAWWTVAVWPCAVPGCGMQHHLCVTSPGELALLDRLQDRQPWSCPAHRPPSGSQHEVFLAARVRAYDLPGPLTRHTPIPYPPPEPGQRWLSLTAGTTHPVITGLTAGDYRPGTRLVIISSRHLIPPAEIFPEQAMRARRAGFPNPVTTPDRSSPAPFISSLVSTQDSRKRTDNKHHNNLPNPQITSRQRKPEPRNKGDPCADQAHR